MAIVNTHPTCPRCAAPTFVGRTKRYIVCSRIGCPCYFDKQQDKWLFTERTSR